MVSSGIKKKIELKIENLFRILAILAQDRLSSRSPFSITGLSVLACTKMFPVIEKSIQGVENIRRLWICKNVSRYTISISYIWLVHEEEEIVLVELEREIIVHCGQIRHL